jgi:hypothetical protein
MEKLPNIANAEEMQFKHQQVSDNRLLNVFFC